MRTKLSVAALALMALAPSGCIYVSTPPQRTVVQETRYIAPAPTDGSHHIATQLSRPCLARPNTYYVYDNVYYRAHPGGYVVVGRPW